jgi:hypothetical protein
LDWPSITETGLGQRSVKQKIAGGNKMRGTLCTVDMVTGKGDSMQTNIKKAESNMGGIQNRMSRES